MKPTRKDLENKIAARAWEDGAFKAELTNDPTGVIRRELQALGITLPQGVEVVVHEESPSQVHLVLPPNPSAPVDTELADADLDLVAGGSDPTERKPWDRSEGNC